MFGFLMAFAVFLVIPAPIIVARKSKRELGEVRFGPVLLSLGLALVVQAFVTGACAALFGALPGGRNIFGAALSAIIGPALGVWLGASYGNRQIGKARGLIDSDYGDDEYW